MKWPALQTFRPPALLFLSSFALLAPLREALSEESRLAVIRTPADFTLTMQDGKAFRLADLRGKVVVVSFIFTTCNGTCPATTQRMSQLSRKLVGDHLTDKVHLLSITLDPARDKPTALREYMRLYEVDAKHWTFLTGSQKQIDKVLSDWGMWVRPGARGQLDHPSRVFLLDVRGRVREIYNLDFFRPKWVLDDVRLLLKEAAE
ncbi:MAG TPA: SCO family protein [Gemmataceae bacterium]|nr:SCO family protein [Gemmataceae bacterium]